MTLREAMLFCWVSGTAVAALVLLGTRLARWRRSRRTVLGCLVCGLYADGEELHLRARHYARGRRYLPVKVLAVAGWLVFGAWTIWTARQEARADNAVVAERPR